MSIVRRVYLAAIFVAALWSIFITILSVIGEPVYFYPTENNSNEAPVHRFEVLRLSMFLTFAYFALMHVLQPDKKFSASHVLISMLTFMVLVGSVVSVTKNFLFGEFGYLVAIGLSAIAIFFASRPRVRRYFARR